MNGPVEVLIPVLKVELTLTGSDNLLTAEFDLKLSRLDLLRLFGICQVLRESKLVGFLCCIGLNIRVTLKA